MAGRIGLELVRRIPWLIFVVVGVTLLTFVISNIIPADPARVAAGLQAEEFQVEIMRERMGLDRPLHEQYLSYMARLAQGDLGESATTSRTVLSDLQVYFPATLELVLAAAFPCIALGVLIGTLSARKPGGAFDKAGQMLTLSGMAMPRFWFAIVLQIIFFRWLGLFPVVGRLGLTETPPPKVTGLYVIDSLIAGQWHTMFDAMWHLVLPATALAIASIANITRVTRVAVVEVLQQDYVRTARSKGMPEWKVLYTHALRNAAIPIVTISGLQFGWLFSGAVLVEIVFGWPGIGKYSVDAIANLDYAPIMGVTLVVALIFVLINLVVDLTYLILDPRISY